MAPLRVAIDARLDGGASGGVEQFVLGLASGLSALAAGDEEYLFLAWRGQTAWLSPHLSGACRLLELERPAQLGQPLALRYPRLLDAACSVAPWLLRRMVTLPASDGAAERAGADLIHFTLQTAFTTTLPSLYHPHDLQHLHLPCFFRPAARVWRGIAYPEFSRRAHTVATASSWVRDDLIEQLEISADKIAVVPLAPVLAEYPEPRPADLASVSARLGLEEPFALYPAQTWEHKNHLVLLRALSVLRGRGRKLALVCPGRKTEYYSLLASEVARLGLQAHVRFPGFVCPLELSCLYRLARLVAVPTLYEAGSFPMWEAFQAGVPVACSDVTSLPRQAGDAAEVFSPRDPASIADALERVGWDEPLRETLAARGRTRLAAFSWLRTARHFRALYRRIADRPLSDDDRALLDAEPLL